MTHADLVTVVWGSLAALGIIGFTVVGVVRAKYEDDDDDS